MLVEWFVDFVFSLFQALIGLLPLPASLELGSLSGAFGVMGTFNALLPVTESLQVAVMLMTLQGGLLFYRVLKIAFSHVPLIGGAG